MLSGLDVSHWTGAIDWRLVVPAGYRFAFCKATESTTYVDDTLLANVQGARAAGLAVGAYHFYRLAATPKSQAEFFLKTIKSLPLDLPPVLDFEEQASLAPAKVADALKTWLDIVAERTGRTPIVYTSAYFWNDFTGGPDWSAQYPLWVANYTNASAPFLPRGWTQWLFWQYSDKGVVPGISANADLNRFNGDEAALTLLAGSKFTPPVSLEERVAALERDLAALHELLRGKGVIS